MKKKITAVCLTIISISFLVGCSSDSTDSITGSIEENIVGRWAIVAHESDNGFEEYYNTCTDYKDYIEFFNGGAYAERSYDLSCESSDTSGRWEIDGYNVKVYSNETKVVKVYTVSHLKGNKLTLDAAVMQSMGVGINLTTHYSRQ